MSLLSVIKNDIKESPKRIQSLLMYNRRRRGGHNGLVQALPRSKKISNEQMSEINEFWHPYLKTCKQKFAYDKRWFDVYNRTNVFGFDLKKFIPNGYYYSIIDMALSDWHFAPRLDDKNLYDLYYSDVKQPDTIIRRINSVYLDADYKIIAADDAIRLCLENEALIVKPSIDAMAGAGISTWKSCEGENRLKKIILEGNYDFVCQKFVKQHEVLSQFCSSCVNTMRIVSLLWRGEVHITSAVLIMGGANAKTNHLHSGGLVCGILPNGNLRHTAFDGSLSEYKSHPNGVEFDTVSISQYPEIVSIIKRIAPRLSNVSKIINWDFTIDELGDPVLIESNLTLGGSVQIASGPAFGELTEEVLDYVIKKGVWL